MIACPGAAVKKEFGAHLERTLRGYRDTDPSCRTEAMNVRAAWVRVRSRR